jgi:hypothetical protein
MTKKHHPSNRAERKRLAEAKALENPLFRQRRINGKKRKIITDLKNKEAEDELRTSVSYDLEESVGGSST